MFGPRFGAAYDVSGDQSFILRGGAGLFYDRPDGNTVFSIPGNPPIATAQDLRNGTLSTLGQGLSPQPVPAMVTFQYDAKVPASWQWQFGAQMALPWASSLDISYVGNHGYDRMGGLQGGNTMNLNAVDIGAAFLPQNQDPTLAPARRQGRTPTRQRAARLQGPRQHQPEHDRVLGHVSLHPDGVPAPVPERLLVRRQLHAGPVARRQHGSRAAPSARPGRHDQLPFGSG